MAGIDEAAEAFRLGQRAFESGEHDSLETAMICEPLLILTTEWLENYADGWRSAQREAQVERHLDEGADLFRAE